MSTPPPALREILADRYRFEREIGRGGMATVYLAEDLKHHREVAVKVLSPEVRAAIGHDRFLREIEIAARLTHPHILPLHDSGAAGDQFYYVMPYIAGESLRARLEREGPLELDEALRLAREIASALGHAHAQGLVHRDVKPENVLLADGIALVADFGIARAVSASGDRGLTTIGVALGTPTYMAPEQVLGSAELDGRADLYSLACVLYEMLSGQPPFSGATAESVLHQHLSVAPPPVTTFRPDVPSGVAAALAKALAKSPSDRYATAARFAAALGVAAGTMATPAPSEDERTIPHNLPRERTSFIGRQQELAELARLVGETRLLTLTGVGGCGKTRLALKLAGRLLSSFPDGVWFVDLGPLPDPERVPLAVARSLEAKEEPGRPLTATLQRHLENKRTLLVLDNCEHLLSACAELVEALLAPGTEVRIVATSREGLGVEGERPYAVRSLSVPGRAAEDDFGVVKASEAVRLFVDRAHVVAPGFALTAENAAVVAEICRRLDGIPLAIELAAARVKLLSVEQIRAKLDDRFKLLTGGVKALPRHQTLRATIQWSYDHLAEDEQRLFRVLAVFAGGWTLEGAAAVTGEADEFGMLDLLTRLVDKSLVVVEREGSEPRYRMLETVRQYAQERLNESGDGDQARVRHLDFHLALAEEAEPRLRGPRQAAWYEKLEREQENLLAALAWCDRAEGGAGKGLRLAGAVRRYWQTRGLLELGLQVTRAALERPGAETPTRARALALHGAASLAYFRGAYAEVREREQESLAIWRALGDSSGAASALNLLGATAGAEEDYATARAHHEEAIAIARGIGDALALSQGLNDLAELLRALGALEEAAPIYEEALVLARGLGDTDGIVTYLLNLSSIEIARGEAESARARLTEALALAREVGSNPQFGIEMASTLAAARGEPARAARLNGAAEVLLERQGARRAPVDERFVAPWIARARSELGEGAFAAAYQAGHALSNEQALAETRAWLEAGAHPGPTGKIT